MHDSHPLWPYVWWNDTVQYICICLSMCQNLWFINYQSNEGITFDVLLICEILKHFDTRAHNMLIPNNLINSITVRWNFSMTGSYFFQPEVIFFDSKFNLPSGLPTWLLLHGPYSKATVLIPISFSLRPHLFKLRTKVSCWISDWWSFEYPSSKYTANQLPSFLFQPKMISASWCLP